MNTFNYLADTIQTINRLFCICLFLLFGMLYGIFTSEHILPQNIFSFQAQKHLSISEL